MASDEVGELQRQLQAAIERAQKRHREMRLANRRAEQAEKAAADHEFYRRNADLKQQREISNLREEIHQESEAKTKALEMNSVLVKQAEAHEKLKCEQDKAVQNAIRPLHQQMQLMLAQLQNAKADQNRAVEHAKNLSVRCEQLETAKKDLEEKLVKSSEIHNTSVQTAQAQPTEATNKDDLQKHNFFLQNTLQQRIEESPQKAPPKAIEKPLDSSSPFMGTKKQKLNDGYTSLVMGPNLSSSIPVGQSIISPIGPNMPPTQPLEPRHLFQRLNSAVNTGKLSISSVTFNTGLKSQLRQEQPVIPNDFKCQPSSLTGPPQDVKPSVENVSTMPSHQSTQESSRIDTTAVSPKDLNNQAPHISQDERTGRVTRRITAKGAPQVSLAPPQPRIVPCLHCHAYWWGETCDNTEPCKNCVATTTAITTHDCERPKCKNYDDPQNCKQNEKCKRAHITDNYEHLVNFKQSLIRRIVKREIPNYPSPALAVQQQMNEGTKTELPDDKTTHEAHGTEEVVMEDDNLGDANNTVQETTNGADAIMVENDKVDG